MSKVPVTILTGHLGAGKTTLLRNLLQNRLGLRIAVIENEFGNEIGIERLLANTSLTDSAIINQKDLFIELSNGCVCCSVKDTLVATLETLLERSKNRFDHIVIETTGLADPGPLAGIFWLDDALESELTLDGVVTVVDLKNLESRLDDPNANEAILQIAYADHLILNKKDLVTDGELSKILSKIQVINPSAPYVVTTNSNVDLKFCLNISAFDKSRLHIRLNQSNRDAMEVVHDPTVRSIVLRRTDKPISLDKLRDWIANMLWEPKSDVEIFRVKGIVWGSENDSQINTVQAVHKLFDIEPISDGTTWRDIDELRPITKIVIIGRGIIRDVITSEFQLL